MRVHQATGAAGPYDAVTEQMGAYRRLLEEWEMAGSVHAAVMAPGAPSMVEALDGLRPDPEDLVIIHYAGYVPGMRPLLELSQRKLLVYHNVTPARYFWRVEPRVALTCELGRAHLPHWIAASHTTAAVSAYNAQELSLAGAAEPRVVPILLDRSRLVAPRANGAAPDAGGPLVLSIGRLAPHKRPDLVIRAFALYQRHHEPGAKLLCVGPVVNCEYLAHLRRLIAEVGATGVRLAGGLPQPQLNAALSQASVFLSLSEHEGFCVPLLEALQAGLPVVARPSGGMPEVGGDAVLWVADDDLVVVAELLRLAVSDPELRAELRARAPERVKQFSWDRVAADVRSAVDAAVA